jgi:hypothetical protein
MAKAAPKNGHDRLEETIAILIQNQAAFLARNTEIDRVNPKTFRRIDADMAAILRVLDQHSRILAEHSRLLEALPDAVRDKIGFRPQP